MPFPNSGLLSEFPGPPENPLSEGGKWAQATPDSFPMQKGVDLATDSVHNGTNYSYWTQQTFNSNNGVEVWACTEGGQLGAALETWRVALWYEVGLNIKGYLAYYGGGIGKGFAIRRYNGGIGNFTGIGGSPPAGYPGGLGLRINGTQVEVWGEYGGVWSIQATATDNTYRGNFFLSIGIEDETGGGLSITCFGAGIKNRTQIYRILHSNNAAPVSA